MKASISTRKPVFNISTRKEEHFSREIVALSLDNDYLRPVVTCRIYATNAMHYACIWIAGKTINTSGTGRAGGYGYHRASAAVQDAITHSGIDLDESISGRGDSAIEYAIKALAELASPESKCYLHTATA